MELLILTIVVLLIVIVVQWARFDYIANEQAVRMEELINCLNFACGDIYTICDAWGASPPEVTIKRCMEIIQKCEGAYRAP